MCARERGRRGAIWDEGSFSGVEFDGKGRMILVSNFVIMGVRMAAVIKINWRLPKSTTHGTKN